VPLAAPATALENACQIKACRNERGCEAPREGPNAMEFAAAGGSKILIQRHKYWRVDTRINQTRDRLMSATRIRLTTIWNLNTSIPADLGWHGLSLYQAQTIFTEPQPGPTSTTGRVVPSDGSDLGMTRSLLH
jgi:hypothetical protein